MGETIRQHFISQTEQRHNSIDGEGTHIWEFALPAGDGFELGRPKRVGIRSTLMSNDLYTIQNRLGESRDLEKAFRRFEDLYPNQVRTLLNPDPHLDADIEYKCFLSLYSTKVLNNFRNPYNWKRNASVFEALEGISTDSNSDVATLFNFYEDGKVGRLRRRRDKFPEPIPEEEYARWRKGLDKLFLLRFDHFPVLNLFEYFMREFTTRRHFDVKLYIYDGSPGILLSDACLSYFHFDDNSEQIFFNIDKSSFAFVDYHTPDEFRPSFRLRRYKNQPEMLKIYNAHAIAYSHRAVYCSKDTFAGKSTVKDVAIAD
jgi:hypothetical protein